MIAHLSKVFKVTLVGMEDKKVNDSIVTTYNFTTNPAKFEIGAQAIFP